MNRNADKQIAKQGLTLTFAQDFSEARDWLVQHKRDPFLWLVTLGPLVLAANTFWGFFVFPPSDATQALKQAFPTADESFKPENLRPENYPKCHGQPYIFGYVFGVWSDHGLGPSGRVCRDIFNGRWVVDIDPKVNPP